MTFRYVTANNPKIVNAIVDCVNKLPVTKATVEQASFMEDVTIVIDSPELEPNTILTLGVIIGGAKAMAAMGI